MAQPHPDPVEVNQPAPAAAVSDAAEAAKWSLYDGALILLSAGVILAAGWLSFDTLENLGMRVGWGTGKSWLLPLCIDVQAMVGTLGWLHPRISDDVRTTARRMTITAVGLSVAGNAVEHVISSWTKAENGWEVLLVLVVGALPVLAMALTIHLVSKLLAGRSRAKADVARAEREAERVAAEEKRKPKGKKAARTTTAPAAPVPPTRTPEVPTVAEDVAEAAARETVLAYVDSMATGGLPPADPVDEPGEVDPWTVVDPRVAAVGEKIEIGERLTRLIDHLTRHGVPIHETSCRCQHCLSGRKLADNLGTVYGISCSEQRGRQVLGARRKQAALAVAATSGEEVNTNP